MTMKYIFVPGIGDDSPSRTADLESTASKAIPGDWTIFQYDDIMDKIKDKWYFRALRKAASFAVSGAVAAYTSPEVGRLAAEHGGGFADKLADPVREHVYDVIGYVFFPTQTKDLILERLVDLLDEIAGEPSTTGITLVGHSMGSIIVVDMLKALKSDDDGSLPIKNIITVGSPLGMTNNGFFKYTFGPLERLIKKKLGKPDFDFLAKPQPYNFINVWSKFDPISGPFRDSVGWQNVQIKAFHRQLGKYLKAGAHYLQNG